MVLLQILKITLSGNTFIEDDSAQMTSIVYVTVMGNRHSTRLLFVKLSFTTFSSEAAG
jgi:hypothetical protein